MRCLAAALMLTAAAPAMADMPPGISHFTLPNGLQAVVIEDHRAPVVVQMVWYRIGSADEAPGKSGIAHYLEHLMFKGTDKLAPGELSKTVTANGGSDNAFTSYDFTAYFQRIAADRLDLVMGMRRTAWPTCASARTTGRPNARSCLRNAPSAPTAIRPPCSARNAPRCSSTTTPMAAR